MRSRLLIWFGFFITGSLIAQSINTRPRFGPDSLGLTNLRKLAKQREFEQEGRIRSFIAQSNVSRRFIDGNGQLVELVDVTETGYPVYEAVDNAGAAVTTGVTSLRLGGEKNLDLQGSGIMVGIWDEGFISHSEFQGRILSQQGVNSIHANHVAGTILATGNNPSARGMAPMATAVTFDFTNDENEILQFLTPSSNSLLFSNHSYGVVSGWRFNSASNSWQWFGDPTISAVEDYKFGYYSSNASFWDQMVYNAPYLTVVKSAGNDRSDVGNGTRPPDCNGGAGYDCIGDFATSKNVITVGAVLKVPNYIDNSSVFMSSFSSWGPTDDGRIKPDIVGAGVSLFSTSVNDTYTTLSGTSMAAPNVTGSLMLLQELYKKNNNNQPMRAATLKALAIHTAKEAGSNVGPDYKFGWGLLDVNRAASLILEKDGQGTIINELTISQGETLNFTLNPKRDSKITATIVWIDPAGTPVSISLDPTNLMLVNDLDVRLKDETGTDVMPWVLNPAFPDAAAIKGDNFRDNVEKIDFEVTIPKVYTLSVSHKGMLKEGFQDFSMIITYSPEIVLGNTYFFLGKTSNLNEPENWSLSSGGVPAMVTPNQDDRVFIDVNSIPNSTDRFEIELNDDFMCRSFIWTASAEATIKFNGNKLIISKDLIFSSGTVQSANPGKIFITGEVGYIDLKKNYLKHIDLIFDNPDGSWNLVNGGSLNLLELKSGKLNASNSEFEIARIVSNNLEARSLDIRNSKFNDLKGLDILSQSLTLQTENTKLNLNGDDTIILNSGGLAFNGQIATNSSRLELHNFSSIDSLIQRGIVSINNDLSLNYFSISAGGTLSIVGGVTLNLSKELFFYSNPQNKISITSDILNKAYIRFNEYNKICLDNLIVQNVDVVGSAVVSAGLGSEISNSIGWMKTLCSEVLFPDFSFSSPCADALVEFVNESQGPFQNASWQIEHGNILNTEGPICYAKISKPGFSNVSLTISNGSDSRTLSKQIEFLQNTVPSNEILVNGDYLISKNTAAGYQWYSNFNKIDGATDRFLNFNGLQGVINVVTASTPCNNISSDFVITGLAENSFEVYPNPTTGVITIQTELPFTLQVFNTLGQLMKKEDIGHSSRDVDLTNLSEGVYFLLLESSTGVIVERIVVRPK